MSASEIAARADELSNTVSALYLAMIRDKEKVQTCEGELIRAAATLGAILDELRQDRMNSVEG